MQLPEADEHRGDSVRSNIVPEKFLLLLDRVPGAAALCLAEPGCAVVSRAA